MKIFVQNKDIHIYISDACFCFFFNFQPGYKFISFIQDIIQPTDCNYSC